MKIQVVLMLFVCYRLVKSIYFASCNNPCNASEESHCSHSTCDICCYRGIKVCILLFSQVLLDVEI